MKVKEVLREQRDKAADVEIYVSASGEPNFLADNLESAVDEDEDSEVIDWQLFGEDDYDHYILANSDNFADFKESYGNSDAKVLVILVKQS